jgi:hypothetical protein
VKFQLYLALVVMPFISSRASWLDQLRIMGKSVDHAFTTYEQYDFDVCSKYQAAQEQNYYLTCRNQGSPSKESNLNNLLSDVNAVYSWKVKSAFLDVLRRSTGASAGMRFDTVPLN